MHSLRLKLSLRNKSSRRVKGGDRRGTWKTCAAGCDLNSNLRRCHGMLERDRRWRISSATKQQPERMCAEGRAGAACRDKQTSIREPKFAFCVCSLFLPAWLLYRAAAHCCCTWRASLHVSERQRRVILEGRERETLLLLCSSTYCQPWRPPGSSPPSLFLCGFLCSSVSLCLLGGCVCSWLDVGLAVNALFWSIYLEAAGKNWECDTTCRLQQHHQNWHHDTIT